MLDSLSGEPHFDDDVPWELVEKWWRDALPIFAEHLQLSINQDGKLVDQSGSNCSQTIINAKGVIIETVSAMIHKFPPAHRTRLIKLITDT